MSEQRAGFVSRRRAYRAQTAGLRGQASGVDERCKVEQTHSGRRSGCRADLSFAIV